MLMEWQNDGIADMLETVYTYPPIKTTALGLYLVYESVPEFVMCVTNGH